MRFYLGLGGCALAVAIFPAIAAAAQPAPDFRVIRPGHGEAIIIDLGTMRIKGAVRRVSFNVTSTDHPNGRVQSYIEMNCDRRLVKTGPVTMVEGDGSHSSPPDQPSGEWQKADDDAVGARLTNLICAAPEDRDQYATKLDATTLQSALAAARADASGTSD